METFTLQSPYFDLLVLFLCFALLKISMSVIHSNSLKMLIVEIHDVLPYFFIKDAA